MKHLKHLLILSVFAFSFSFLPKDNNLTVQVNGADPDKTYAIETTTPKASLKVTYFEDNYETYVLDTSRNINMDATYIIGTANGKTSSPYFISKNFSTRNANNYIKGKKLSTTLGDSLSLVSESNFLKFKVVKSGEKYALKVINYYDDSTPGYLRFTNGKTSLTITQSIEDDVANNTTCFFSEFSMSKSGILTAKDSYGANMLKFDSSSSDRYDFGMLASTYNAVYMFKLDTTKSSTKSFSICKTSYGANKLSIRFALFLDASDYLDLKNDDYTDFEAYVSYPPSKSLTQPLGNAVYVLNENDIDKCGDITETPQAGWKFRTCLVINEIPDSNIATTFQVSFNAVNSLEDAKTSNSLSHSIQSLAGSYTEAQAGTHYKFLQWLSTYNG